MNIETGIPIPPVQSEGHGGTKGKYPWHDLEVGQSFLVACANVERTRRFNCLTKCKVSAQRTIAKQGKGNRLFALRGVQGGIRVWRTA